MAQCGKEPLANAGDTDLILELGRSSGGRQWQLTPVILPGKSQGQWATVHGVAKESDMAE